MVTISVAGIISTAFMVFCGLVSNKSASAFEKMYNDYTKMKVDIEKIKLDIIKEKIKYEQVINR